MFLRELLFPVTGLLVSIGIAGCAGAGVAVPRSAAGSVSSGALPASSIPALTQSVVVRLQPAPAMEPLRLTPGLSGSITLHSTSSNQTVEIGTEQPGTAGHTTPLSRGGCPPVPPIVIYNPLSKPVTITLDSFTVRLPCSVNGLLFGASAYQSYPVPPTLVSTKLGDAVGTRNTITFTPTVSQLTFPAKTALTISILPEASKAFTQLPAIPNTATVLTSNAPTVPNSLALEFPNVQGGPTFQSACFLPNDPNGPGLRGIHVLGTPAFYCALAPGQKGTSTTFGGSGSNVQFLLGPNVPPDASFVGLDGPQIFAACTPATGGQACTAPSFTVPVYSKAYVSNITDIAACVPTVANADCNGVAGNPKAPSAPTVSAGQAFQLLFADDPSYNAANTFGGVTLEISGTSPPCTIRVGPDHNHDAPPSYADPGTQTGATGQLADFTGAGPYVEFDIDAVAPGTCIVNMTEDTGLKRAYVFQIPVQSGS